MTTNSESNITRKIARVFLPAFEGSKVLCKTVNTQLLNREGLTPQYGTEIRFKRPHQYAAVETADGDISSSTKNDIKSGSAVGTVQNMITVPLEFSNFDEATSLDQLEEIVRPAAEECVTRLETNLADFMIGNNGLAYGTPGTVVDQWGDVAGAGSLMSSIGVPKSGNRYYVMNPFTTQNLANTQSGLASGSSSLVDTAWQKSQISMPFAGLSGLMSNALSNYTSGATTDRAGALAANPDKTYVTAKDTYQQTLSLTGLQASVTGALKKGDVLEFDDRYYVNLATRKTFTGADGQPVKWRATVTADANTDGSGNATVIVSPAAISDDATGQYTNISAPLQSGDTFTILGAAGAEYQPNLFYHEMAYGLGTVRLPKLYSTDTIVETNNGFSIRVSKYTEGDKNLQRIRFDLLPAFACFNPLFAGKGFGV